MENPTCRQYNLYMHEEDTFPCRRYIVKYDDKGIAEEAFSIKRNNTEDFPEFFDDRIFKTGQGHGVDRQRPPGNRPKRCNASSKERAKRSGLTVIISATKNITVILTPTLKKAFLKKSRKKCGKSKKTTAFPVAGQQDGNLLPAQETERNADEVPAKQLAANAKNAALKKFWHNLKARF